jgi:hypothetical protein
MQSQTGLDRGTALSRHLAIVVENGPARRSGHIKVHPEGTPEQLTRIGIDNALEGKVQTVRRIHN